MPSFFTFFYFLFSFLYDVFIVFKYKKPRAALAMEKTKPINQNKQQKEPLCAVPPRRLKAFRPKPLAYCCKSETKYKEITMLKLLVIYVFFTRKDICRENKTTNHLHEGNKQNLRRGDRVS